MISWQMMRQNVSLKSCHIYYPLKSFSPVWTLTLIEVFFLGERHSRGHHISFFFLNHISMNNELTDDQWRSLIRKSVFPLQTFLVSAFTEFVREYRVYSFQTYNEVRKFCPRHLCTECIRVFPTCFHWQKMWGKDH